MLTSHRFIKTIATTLCGALAAYAVATGFAEPDACAQISGTTGGDLVGHQLIESRGDPAGFARGVPSREVWNPSRVPDQDDGILFAAPPSGSVLVTADEIASGWTDGTSNTVMVGYTVTLENVLISGYSVAIEGPRRVRIAADVTTADPAGGTRTERIIAILIGLFAPQVPGFMDYTDDACMLADGGAPGDAQLRGCAFVSRTFRAFMHGRRLAVSPQAVMAQTPAGIAIWEPR